MRKLWITTVLIVLVLCLPLAVTAEETQDARDISEETMYTGSGYSRLDFLKDKNIYEYTASSGNAEITLENAEGMAALYLLFDLEYGEYTVTDNAAGTAVTMGTYGFIHEFIDLEAAFGYAPASVTLHFANGSVHLSEIYVFTSGQLPLFVQKWEPPLDGCADILLMPTHGDDDHLYFAGLLPYYAGELDCAVQVAYLSSHRCYTTVRVHEILNGLWNTGVENYPTFGYSLDFRVWGDGLEKTYQVYENNGISREDLVGFVVEQFRRFKPQVVVGHDINGEYGHGMHKVYTDLIMQAVELSNDPESYPELALKYGVWDVPKTYLHSLEKNPIVIDYDTPLERFNGLTAFQVTQKYGFPCHASQHIYDAFLEWLYGKEGEITKASQIERHNPSKFGLYRSTVGEDVLKNDLLENVITYSEQARLEQERLLQEELEKQRQEQLRLEQEKQEQEKLEQQKQEQERLAREEQEMLEQLEQQIAQTKRQYMISILCVAALLTAGFTFGSQLAKKQMAKRNGIGGQKKLKK